MKLTYVHKTALSWSPNLSVRDMAASLGSQPQSLSVLESETVFISTLSGDSQKIKWQCPVSFATEPSVELSFWPMLEIAVMGVLRNPGSIEPSAPIEPLVRMLSIPSLPQLRPTPPLLVISRPLARCTFIVLAIHSGTLNQEVFPMANGSVTSTIVSSEWYKCYPRRQ